ncbi:transposase [Sinorhizobium meliloti]|nr:transposase [Sinorhizobium meliloti]
MSEAAKRGRRNWSLEDKWRIVQAAPLPGNSAAEVARRRGVNSDLLFRWIRAAEAGQLGHRPIPLCFCRNPLWTSFRWVCLDEAMTKGLRRRYRSPPLRRPPRWRVRRGPNRCCRPKGPTLDERPGVIESVRVRVDAFVNEKALRRVLTALGA